MPESHEKRGEKEVSRIAKEKSQEKSQLDKVIEADKESFPASDAPGWTGSTAGRPHYEPKKEREDSGIEEPPRD